MPGSPGSARAMGSASELEYHLLLAKDLELMAPKDHAELSQRVTELKPMLTALLQKLTAHRLSLKAPVSFRQACVTSPGITDKVSLALED